MPEMDGYSTGPPRSARCRWPQFADMPVIAVTRHAPCRATVDKSMAARGDGIRTSRYDTHECCLHGARADARPGRPGDLAAPATLGDPGRPWREPVSPSYGPGQALRPLSAKASGGHGRCLT